MVSRAKSCVTFDWFNKYKETCKNKFVPILYTFFFTDQFFLQMSNKKFHNIDFHTDVEWFKWTFYLAFLCF